MNNIMSYIERITQNKGIAVFDFDWTLTTLSSNSSIGIFTKYLPETYKKPKKILDYLTSKAKSYYFYKIIWYLKLKLLAKFYSRELICSINYKNDFIINDHSIKILEYLKREGCEIIIYSSGIGEIIKQVFKVYNIDLKGIKIIANDIDFKTKKFNKKIITPQKEKLDLKNNFVILFGDKLNDLCVVENAYKVLVKDDVLEAIDV